MPKVTVEGHGTFEVPLDKKLVLAIEDAGIPILHRCGGVPACTTCRVQVLSGDVSPMKDDEKEALEDPDLIANYRLSCQVRVQNDLTVKLWKTLPEFRADNKNPDLGPGDRPED